MEQKLFDALGQPHSLLRVPMGEQKRKPFRSQPAPVDEIWGSPVAADAAREVLRPARVLLVRHGESQGNQDGAVYTRVSDWRIPLTPTGHRQAQAAGQRLRELIGDEDVYFYYSPYLRAVETCQTILESFNPSQVRGMRQDPRIAEQQFGNLQDVDQIRKSKDERHKYGRFFYRFPNGEAGLDVYSRVTSFIGTLRRDHAEDECAVVIVTHGLALRLFLMAWFEWTVEQFETTRNPPNCGIAVMDRVPGSAHLSLRDQYRLCPETCQMIGCVNTPITSPCLGQLWGAEPPPSESDQAQAARRAAMLVGPDFVGVC